MCTQVLPSVSIFLRGWNEVHTKNYVVHFSLMMGWFLATHQSSAVVPLLGFCIACTISELSLCDLCATDSAISWWWGVLSAHTQVVEKEFWVILSHPPHLFHSVSHPNSYCHTCMIYATRTVTCSLLSTSIPPIKKQKSNAKETSNADNHPVCLIVLAMLSQDTVFFSHNKTA